MTDAANEWLDLLPWATCDERRTLLDSEYAAALFAGALRAARIPQRFAFESVAFEMLATVCVAVHGTPGELIEGKSIDTRSVLA